MKYLIFLMSFIICTTAQAVTMDECTSSGQIFGDGRGKVRIPSACQQLVLDNSYINAYRDYGDKDIVVFGHKNFLYIYLGPRSLMRNHVQTLPQEFMISGEQSQLADVLAVDVDFKNKLLVVLAIDAASGKKAIFTYRLWRGGNLAPVRRIFSDEIQEATSIRVDPKSEYIYVLFDKLATIKTYSLIADVDGRREGQKIEVKEMLVGPKTLMASVKDITFSNDGKFLYVLDKSQNKVFAFSSTKLGDIPPISSIEIKQKDDIQVLKIGAQEKILIGVDSKGLEHILAK